MRTAQQWGYPELQINRSDQLHTSAPLPPGKNTKPTQYEAGWTPEYFLGENNVGPTVI